MSNHERDLSQFLNYDDIDLRKPLSVLWANKLFLAVFTSLFALVSIIYSLTLNNIYTAQTLLAPNSTSDLSANLSQYSNLASMAGITLPRSSSGISDKDIALSLIKSKALLQKLINEHNILPDLFAAQAWDLESGVISYDQNLYDHDKGLWVRKVKPPHRLIPSAQEAFAFFEKGISISEDKKTGVITLEVDHLSPEVAYQWSLLIIQEINEYVADMRIKEAQLSIDYLNDQIKITPYPELRAMFYELIQQHTQSMMLAKVRHEYALTTLDAPLIPEEKSGPQRLLLVVLLSFLGFILSIFIILIRLYFFKLEDSMHLNFKNFQ